VKRCENGNTSGENRVVSYLKTTNPNFVDDAYKLRGDCSSEVLLGKWCAVWGTSGVNAKEQA
jgi:hypothetical protein